MQITDAGLANECARVQATCGCEGVRRAARRVTQHYEQALAPSGLRAPQFPILVALESAGPLPLTRLAAALALDRTTLTRNLRILRERSLVDIVDGDDGRVRVVGLTEEGRRCLRDGLARWRGVQASVQERFGEARLAHLLSELAALMDVVRT